MGSEKQGVELRMRLLQVQVLVRGHDVVAGGQHAREPAAAAQCLPWHQLVQRPLQPLLKTRVTSPPDPRTPAPTPTDDTFFARCTVGRPRPPEDCSAPVWHHATNDPSHQTATKDNLKAVFPHFILNITGKGKKTCSLAVGYREPFHQNERMCRFTLSVHHAPPHTHHHHCRTFWTKTYHARVSSFGCVLKTGMQCPTLTRQIKWHFIKFVFWGQLNCVVKKKIPQLMQTWF